ncbi:hypothetical protein [Thalassotalea sp. ND16A]|uniref:hypothetical protein n=1 Tax=Thalassotalea sp. ND16A TaxID=1535422 RepID=UPI00051DE1A1|nr:hypothetical protein [Thalassotalea sp. ND16A]KGJ97144.1 hypothetical protein ND16A_0066 [Thalassotalea sp. ND16A]
MKQLMKANSTLATFWMALFSISTFSISAAAAENVEQQLQQLKADVVDIASELQLLEEQMLYPQTEQLAVYVSIDAGNSFTLSAVKLVIDGENVATSQYDDIQIDALQRGGIDRMFMGEIDVGEHVVTAFFSGTDSQGNKLKRGLSTTVHKTSAANALELKIGYNATALQPQFVAVEL